MERYAIAIDRVANGYIVRGEHSFQHNGPSTSPGEWHVFESFEALALFLRKTLTDVKA